MKEQIFYVAGLLICLFFAFKVMAKVKDIPKEDENKEPVEPEEEEELDSEQSEES